MASNSAKPLFTLHHTVSPHTIAIPIEEKDEFVRQFEEAPKAWSEHEVRVVFLRGKPWGVRYVYNNSLFSQNEMLALADSRALHLFLHHHESNLGVAGDTDKPARPGHGFLQARKHGKIECTECTSTGIGATVKGGPAYLPSTRQFFKTLKLHVSGCTQRKSLRELIGSVAGERQAVERYIAPGSFASRIDAARHGKSFSEGTEDERIYELWRIDKLVLFLSPDKTIAEYCSIVQWRGCAIRLQDFTVEKGLTEELVAKANRLYAAAVLAYEQSGKK